jgi:Lrp/AsnC family leucine-responsive transcriptional regulator
MIDSTDRQILSILQENARTSNAEVARRVAMAPSAVYERIRKLEERGVIAGYHARLAGDELALGLQVFVSLRGPTGAPPAKIVRSLDPLPEVLEIHHVAGEDAFLLKVRVPDLGALSELLQERIGGLPGIRDVRTSIVLDTFKETSILPVGLEDPPQAMPE